MEQPKKNVPNEQVSESEKFKMMMGNAKRIPNMSFKKTEQEDKKWSKKQNKDPDVNEEDQDAKFSISGTLTRANPFFGEESDNNYDYLVMIDNPSFNGMVVSGIPVVNWYLEYTIFLLRTKYKPQGKAQFKVDIERNKSITMKHLPLTGKLLETMIRRELLNNVNAVEANKTMNQFFEETKLGRLGSDQIYDRKEVGKALLSFKFPTDISDSIQLKYYFLHSKVEELYKVYKDYDMILGLPWESIPQLLHNVKTDPISLCFRRCITYRMKLKTDKETIKANGYEKTHKKIPEMTYSQLSDVIDMYGLSTSIPQHHVVGVKMYERIKIDVISFKHCYSRKAEVIREGGIMCGSNEIAEKGLEFTSDKIRDATVIVKDLNPKGKQDKVYQKKMYIMEMSAVWSLEAICKRRLEKGSALELIESDLTKVRIDGKFPLSKEQLVAYNLALTCPFLTITGPGGSGKTGFLESFIRNIKDAPKKVLLAAFMGTNVAQLNRLLNTGNDTPDPKQPVVIFSNRAFTIHMLLITHRSTCLNGRTERDGEIDPKEALVNKKGIKKFCTKQGLAYDKCIFEDVELMVLDEAGTVDLELYSKLLSCLACCSKVATFIQSGDIAQLPPIGAGMPFESTMKACESMGTYIRFTSNHRAAECKILRDNLVAITEKRIDDVRFDGKSTFNIKINRKDQVVKAVLDTLEKYNIGHYEHHIITRTNEIKRMIQWPVDQYYYKKEGNPPSNARGPTHLKGSKITFKTNNYDRGIFNNSIYRITDIVDIKANVRGQSTLLHKESTATPITKNWSRDLYIKNVLVPNEAKVVPWDKWTSSNISWASCGTINSFQGLQIDTIIIVIPVYTQFVTYQSIVTAFGRAVKRIFYIGDVDHLACAMENEEKPRNSQLCILVKKYCEGIINECKEMKMKEYLDEETDTTDDTNNNNTKDPFPEFNDEESLQAFDTILAMTKLSGEDTTVDPKEVVPVIGSNRKTKPTDLQIYNMICSKRQRNK